VICERQEGVGEGANVPTGTLVVYLQYVGKSHWPVPPDQLDEGAMIDRPSYLGLIRSCGWAAMKQLQLGEDLEPFIQSSGPARHGVLPVQLTTDSWTT